MAFGDGERLRVANQRIRELEGALADRDERLSVREAAGRVTVAVEAELVEYTDSGMDLQDAEAIAKVAVLAKERELLKERLAADLQTDRYDEFVAVFRQEEGPGIRRAQDELFKSDGTYERIDAKAEEDTRVLIQAELLEEAGAAAEAEYSSDKVRAKLIKEETARLKESGALDEVRAAVRARHEEDWQADALAEAKQEIEEEEAEREPEFHAKYIADCKASPRGEEYRKKVRKELEAAWIDKSLEQIAEVVKHEELTDLLTTRANAEAEKLRREQAATELLAKFKTTGLDTSKIPEGSCLIIQLGEIKLAEVTERYQDRYNDWQSRKANKDVLFCRRTIKLTSQGGGKFIVNFDSLHDADSAYVRNDAIDEGTVITVGRGKREAGVGRLDMRIVLDVPLLYDEDSADPETFTDALEPVANVWIDDISARGYFESRPA